LSYRPKDQYSSVYFAARMAAAKGLKRKGSKYNGKEANTTEK